MDEARLEAAKEEHSDAAASLAAWRSNVRSATWQHLMEVRQTYRTADYSSWSGWTFFNIKGNHYRLAVVINYQNQTVTIVDLYTHEEYDKLLERR
ncbi:MAG: type II toxin-antitoxin system HigB family toxin [Chloroflexota bacterium]|nr:type II toxin-antitoxin system HigB family toxin [Chloroflexota bacterium]